MNAMGIRIYSDEPGRPAAPGKEKRAQIRCLQKALLQKALRDAGLSADDREELPPVRKTTYGKPYFPSLPDFHFNFSDSGRFVVLAVSSEGPVGIDLQQIVPVRAGIDRMAARFYTKEEAEALSAVSSPAEKERMFFRLWTIKEAYLKFLGIGLSGGMNRYSLRFASAEEGEILPRGDVPAGVYEKASFRCLTAPEEGYLMTMVYKP